MFMTKHEKNEERDEIASVDNSEDTPTEKEVEN